MNLIDIKETLPEGSGELQIRDLVQTRVAQALRKRGKVVRQPHWFQSAASASVLDGNDTIVRAFPGAGKSYCFQMIALASSSKIVIVLCPLISLMIDQVAAAQKLGIKAAALYQEAIDRDNTLPRRAFSGEFQLLFASPEFLCNSVTIHRKFFQDSAKLPNDIRAIVVDEAHLIVAWQEFRPAYTSIGNLRTLLPNIPFLILSATLPLDVINYIQNGLRMNVPTHTIQLSSDKPNVTWFTVPFRYPEKSFRDLEWLLREGEKDKF
jgi:ATP-dependent DNA helicase RecQ